MAINTPKSVTVEPSKKTRYLIVAAVVALAFFMSYQVARGLSGNSVSAVSGGTLSTAFNGAGTGGTGGAGGCCGSGGSGATGGTTGAGAAGASGGGCCGGAQAPASAQQAKAATIEGGVQKISVDVSKGYYDPTNITLKAGIPAEITFSQASGCTGYVQSADLGFQFDLSSGPQTAKLPALKPGEYSFYCGMQMVYGKIVVSNDGNV